MEYREPKLIAEIGCNHAGRIGVAKKLVLEAAHAGAYACKFQKRSPRELLSNEQFNSPHPNPEHAFGDTYGQHREFLELRIDQHMELAAFCKDAGVVYSTSVWDMTSAREVVEKINPEFIKVPSACNNHEAMLVYLRDAYKGPIHLSCGMTTDDEAKAIYRIFKECLGRLVLYACTSGYPVPATKAYLLELPHMVKTWGACGVGGIGYSGHHQGIALDMAAYALGAEWIERHFTLDCSAKGTDHIASLEPQPFQKLALDLKHAHEAMKQKPDVMDPMEKVQRDKLKFRDPLRSHD